MKHEYAFTSYIIFIYTEAQQSWNPYFWETRTSIGYVLNTMDADGLAMPGASASAAMVLT